MAGLLCGAPAGLAVSIPWLYDVDVAVEGRTTAARMAVSGVALAEVLSRVTGLEHVPRNAEVREALARPEAYYDRFVFVGDGELRIHFVPGAILRLIDAARLPVWSSNRPAVLAWLVVESGGVRQIVDGDHALAAVLVSRARQRGLVLGIPLMDLEDRMHIQPSVVRGRLFSTLERASKRYRAEVILVGQLQEHPCPSETEPLGSSVVSQASPPQAAIDQTAAAAGPSAGASRPETEAASEQGAAAMPRPGDAMDSDLVQQPRAAAESAGEPGSGDSLEVPAAHASLGVPVADADDISKACERSGGVWHSASVEAWMNGEEFAAGFAAADLQDAGRMTADFIADQLAGRFAVLARAPNWLALTIRGIKSPVGYGRLLRYLDGLEFVTAVEVATVAGDRLEVRLRTRAGLEQLVELFASDGRIRRAPGERSVLTWQGP